MVDISPVVDALFGLPGVALFVVTLYLVIRSVTVVGAYERYVVSDGETVDAVLDPGLHVVSPADWGDGRVDMREMDYEGTVDDRSTADGVPVAFDVAYEFVVTDPGAAVVETDDYVPPQGTDWYDHQTAASERLGEAVVEAVEDRTWDELAGAEGDLAAAIRADAEPALDRWGMELSSVDVTDLRRRDGDEDDSQGGDAGEEAEQVDAGEGPGDADADGAGDD
jgi:regulator of protease activity HflC (stomatin/prohibitin superfamily)